MKEYALTINLKNDPDLIEQYKEYHRNPWPEVIEGLKARGVTKMKIYLLGRRMFMLMETLDEVEPRRDLPRTSEWQELMNRFQERVPEAKPGEHWAAMEKVFDFTNSEDANA